MTRRGSSLGSPVFKLIAAVLLGLFCASGALGSVGAPVGPIQIDLPPVEYRSEATSRPYVPDGRATYVPNEYIIHCLPGTSLSMVRKAVEAMGGTLIKALSLPDTYLVRMGRQSSSRTPRYFIAGAVTSGTKSSDSPRVASYVIDSIQPNFIYRPCAVPNDPYWDRQWNMVQINMPGAWGIEKGSDSVTVAVVDSGVAYTHPDLVNRCVPGVDTFDNDYDPFDYPPGDGVGHGTHVAGIIAAQGNNNEGVCGVCWDGVKVMPVRALGPIDGDHTAGTTETITSGLDWAMNHGAHVVNMSLGSPAQRGDGVYRAKIAQLAKVGIIVVAAAGNSGATAVPDVNLPGLYPEVICVSATNENDEIAAYSSYGPAYEVDIAAPGGEIYRDANDVVQGAIWSTYIVWIEVETGRWLGFYAYAGLQGTSMACPHVAGAAGLLLSQGIPANQVRSRLLQTARVPDEPIVFDRRKYGAGILDVQAALSNAGIKILSPARGARVEADPTFSIALLGLNNATVKVYFDYATEDGTPLSIASETPLIDGVNPALSRLDFKWSDYSAAPLSPGRHFMYVTAFPKAGGSPVSDWVMFQVVDRTVPGGLHLFAFPFILDTASVLPNDILLGTDFSTFNPNRSVLRRYMALLSDYATYIPGISTDMAWVNPMYGTQPTGGGYFDLVRLSDTGAVLARRTARFGFPVGAGFWLILPNQPAVPLNTSFPTLMNYVSPDGYVFDAMRGFNIPLYAGWNMFGNPYPHAVPWRNVRFTYQGETKSLDEAAAAGWVQPNIFAYRRTGTPGYDRLSERDNLEPFTGYWLRAFVGSSDPTRSLMLNIRP